VGIAPGRTGVLHIYCGRDAHAVGRRCRGAL